MRILVRYGLYTLGILLLAFALSRLEIQFPGMLKFHTFAEPGSTYGTSEYSPVEMMQLGVLAICALLCAWVARDVRQQRPIAFLFGAIALGAFVRELHYFLDLVADNLWQVILAVAMALVIAYTLRHRRRLRVAWGRVWPSTAIGMLFSGALVLLVFVPFIGHEPLWRSIMGEGYQRVAKLAAEELMELMGYYLWLVGSIEYTIQALALAEHDPVKTVMEKKAERRRRERHRSR